MKYVTIRIKRGADEDPTTVGIIRSVAFKSSPPDGTTWAETMGYMNRAEIDCLSPGCSGNAILVSAKPTDNSQREDWEFYCEICSHMFDCKGIKIVGGSSEIGN